MDSELSQKIAELHEKSKAIQAEKPISSLIEGSELPSPETFKDHFLAIHPEQGEAIYQLLVDRNCKTVVEFGTSFGISTLYLLGAMKVTDGFVITSELIPEKAHAAQKCFNELNLQNFVDVRIGDATQTLADNITNVDFLLLDGWKDLYLDVLHLIEPHMKTGGLVYVDNADMDGVKPTLDYIAYSNRYRSKTLHEGKAVLAERV